MTWPSDEIYEAIPWDDIVSTPAKFIDLGKYSGLRVFVKPGSMTQGDAFGFAKIFTELSTNRPYNPFSFKTKAEILGKIRYMILQIEASELHF